MMLVITTSQLFFHPSLPLEGGNAALLLLQRAMSEATNRAHDLFASARPPPSAAAAIHRARIDISTGRISLPERRGKFNSTLQSQISSHNISECNIAAE